MLDVTLKPCRDVLGAQMIMLKEIGHTLISCWRHLIVLDRHVLVGESAHVLHSRLSA